MTTDQKLKLAFGIISILLLVTLLFKLTEVPGGMILSGLFLGGILIVGILLGSLVLSLLLQIVFKKNSFFTIYAIVISLAFITFHYYIYSPILKIVVPNGYHGEVKLIYSKEKGDVLTIDSNGIGYLGNWTFYHSYTRPIVKQANGKDLDRNLKGYNRSSFWSVSTFHSSDRTIIESKGFKIIPDSLIGLDD
jgi:hypothetical protein